MALGEKRRLGDILIDAGKITIYQLQEALKSQRVLGKKLGEVLVESRIISEEDILEAIETQTGIEKIDLNSIEFDNKTLNLVTENLCRRHILIPFGFKNNKIQIAMSDPLNIFAIDDVNISTGIEPEIYISSKSDIQKFIDLNYSTEQVFKAAQELTKETLESKNIADNIEEIDDVKNAPVVKMIDYMFRNSIEMRA